MQTLEVVTWALRQSRRRFRTACRYSLAFKLLDAAVLTPLVTGTLRLLLERWGRASVGNFEIASFLLSPPGLLAVMSIGTLSLAGLYLELAGLMRLLTDERLAWWQGLAASGRLFHRLLETGLRQLVAYLLLAAPFLAGIWAVYWWLWSGRDLNGLIVLKPPVFWLGVGLAGAVGVAYAVIAGRWFLQWLSAVPTVLFEPSVSVSEALRLSTQRSTGRLRHLLGAVALWALVQVVLSLVVFGLLRFVSAAVLERIGDSLVVVLPTTAGLLTVHGVAAAWLSVFSTMTFAGLVLALYEQPLGTKLPRPSLDASTGRVRGPSFGWVLAGGLFALTIGTGLLSDRLLRTLSLTDNVEITAHRAGAAHAPENSVAALRRAIADRADWAEVDVQLTQDKALVIMHDIDLARIGGGNRRVDAATFAEIRSLDIGTPFGEEFAGEQVPTLEEILTATGRQIRLNVELKPHGKADEAPLTERVVAAIQQAGMVDRCRLCSQSYASLQLARRLEPSLPVGFIAATALGDLDRLDIDFLMVKSEQATQSLVERARLRKIAVHAWTVNDPAWVAPLLDRGVANLITDDPARLRGRLEELLALSTVERLLVQVRNELIESQPK